MVHMKKELSDNEMLKTKVLEILNKTDGKPFNDNDLQWLEIFATQAV